MSFWFFPNNDTLGGINFDWRWKWFFIVHLVNFCEIQHGGGLSKDQPCWYYCCLGFKKFSHVNGWNHRYPMSKSLCLRLFNIFDRLTDQHLSSCRPRLNNTKLSNNPELRYAGEAKNLMSGSCLPDVILTSGFPYNFSTWHQADVRLFSW